MIDIFFVEDIFPRSEGVEIDGTAESGFEDIGDESFVESGEAFVRLSRGNGRRCEGWRGSCD